MEIKDILKNRRLELSLTMADVAKSVGVSEATVSRWESGDIANMRRDRIAALATVLQISPAVIMGWDDKEDITINAYNFTPNDDTNIFTDNMILKMFKEHLPQNVAINGHVYNVTDKMVEDCYTIYTISDDSMYPEYKTGDKIVVAKCKIEHSGQVVFLSYKGEKMLRRVEYNAEKSRYKLSCINVNIPPVIIEGTEVEQMEIIGTVEMSVRFNPDEL